MPMYFDFTDKSVTYGTFVTDVARVVMRMMAEVRNDPEVVSQNKAYKMFGRANVDRWRRTGKLKPLAKRPGKVEYRTADLRSLQRFKQDYL